MLTVRSPPGLAKTPLSALGLKPHNPAEILLHPVGGECRHGSCWRFSGGGCVCATVRIPLEGSPGCRRHFCLPFWASWPWGPCHLLWELWDCVRVGGMLVLPWGAQPSRVFSGEGWKTPESCLLHSPIFFPPPSLLSPSTAGEGLLSGSQAGTVSRALSILESDPRVQSPSCPGDVSQSSLPSQTSLLPST